MKTLFLSLLILSLSPLAQAARLPVVLVEHLDDKVLALSVEERELARLPHWQPGQGPVPLDIDQVIEKVRTWALTTYPQFDDVRFPEILLKPIESPRYGRVWHYLVSFRGIEARRAAATSSSPYCSMATSSTGWSSHNSER